MVPKSSNRNKQRIKVARIHEKVVNSRKDFVEKISTQVVKTYDIICIEDLNVKAMQQWNGRMVQEAPFRLIREKITWKANKFGKQLVVIDRFDPTSKVCSGCGSLLDLSLSDRWIDCDCGLSIHRDHNAAKNIRSLGLSRTVGTTGFQACGDTKVHSADSSIRWVSLKQETTRSLA
jgi:putative transposase